MGAFLIYIGKSAIAAGAFYLVYLALFQHQKQFVFNRIYLPVSLALSFLIPLITFTSVNYISTNQTINTNSFAYLPEAIENTQPEFIYQWYHYLFGIYILGTIGFLFHLLLGHLKAFAIIRWSRLKELFGAQVNLTPKDVHPFSFFNKIVLSEKTLDNPNLEVIVNHEMIHVKEKHTHDILFAEILFLLQWFNPFAWLIKDAIRNNLEYKTDHQITKNNNAEAYQLAMVGLVHKKGVAPFLTALNGSQLKNRIIMMKKKTENKYALVKQLVVLPLLAILVMSLSNKEVRTEVVNNAGQLKVVVDGVELPADHPELIQLDFTNGFDGGEVIKALGIEDKVISNTLLLDEDSANSGVYYIQTIDYEEGSNPDFEYLVSGYQSIEDKFKIVHVVNNSNTLLGKIKDTYSNLPIQGASIKIDVLDIEVNSDEKGNFLMRFGKNEKPLIVQVSAKDYYTNNVVYYGTDSELNVTLIPIEDNKMAVASEKIIKRTVTDEKETLAAQAAVRLNNLKQDTGKVIIDVAPKGENTKNDEGIVRKINFDTGEIVEVSSTKGYKHFVTGKITDKDGNPIPAVSVFILNKTIGTVSDANGNYKLGLNNTDVTLATWATGYKEQEIEVNGKEEINFKLIADEESKLKKVKVVGYGVQKNSTVNEVLQIKATGDGKNQPLYIVDGIEKESIEYLQPDAIESISVLKDESATSLYGEKGENGVIIITTKEAANKKLKNAIVVVDGKKYEGDISDIDPENIEKMEVLKNESATKLYGPEAKDGAIIITSKNKVNFDDKSPLIMIDGVKSTKDVNDIDPDQIKSIDVLKDASALATYGAEGKDGVILITTKSDEITSEMDLRKFIAKKMKYPQKAQQANKEGIAELFVKVNADGIIYSVSEKKDKNAINIGEVVVVAYAPAPEEIIVETKKDDLSKSFISVTKSVINQLPKLDIADYKGKTIAFTVKFMLQEK